MAFFGLDAASLYVRVVDPYQGIVYESNVSPVSTDGINDWYDYFFSPVEVNEDFVLLDVPVGSYGSIDITVAKPSGIARVGALILGKAAVLGEALYGTSVGITDYSRKERDDFGNTVIVERDYSKRAEFDVMVPTSMISQVQRLLSKYRAKPLVWIGEASYQSTILYGYYKGIQLGHQRPDGVGLLNFCRRTHLMATPTITPLPEAPVGRTRPAHSRRSPTTSCLLSRNSRTR